MTSLHLTDELRKPQDFFRGNTALGKVMKNIPSRIPSFPFFREHHYHILMPFIKECSYLTDTKTLIAPIATDRRLWIVMHPINHMQNILYLSHSFRHVIYPLWYSIRLCFKVFHKRLYTSPRKSASGNFSIPLSPKQNTPRKEACT